jgi:hypothetical protein
MGSRVSPPMFAIGSPSLRGFYEDLQGPVAHPDSHRKVL